MTPWTISQLLDATQGRLRGRERFLLMTGIAIDSRTLVPGDAFVAIRGTRFDGHQFIPEAIRKGAACLILAQPTQVESPVPMILVEDTVRALGDLARAWRLRFRLPVIAVTGSCGKTTTKDLIAHLLSGTHRVLKTTGTQNNQIGLPLTLLRLTDQHDVAVVELGSNHPGEIAQLGSITQPTIGVITNVGPSHLEYFGSLDEVLREKLSLLQTVMPPGCAVLPGDQLEVVLEATSRFSDRLRLVRFGTTDRCEVRAVDIQRTDNGTAVRLRDLVGKLHIPLLGAHNVENALAALACIRALRLPLNCVRERLATFQPAPMRSELIRMNGLTIFNDCYNANPLSFARALETFRDVQASRKIVVVGDMLELGPYASAAHQAIGRLAAQAGADAVVAVGAFSRDVTQGASEASCRSVVAFSTVEDLLQKLPTLLRSGDGVLIKGSRRLRLEQVTEFLRAHASLEMAHPTGQNHEFLTG